MRLKIFAKKTNLGLGVQPFS